ncbi:MAG: hypothetical protein ACXVYY_01005 [Oryzihumus sp.]
MIGIRSISFGDPISITYAELDDVREFAMVGRTLVLNPAGGEYGELVEAAEAAVRALLLDVLEDISLTEPLKAPTTPEVPDDDDEA